MPRDVLDWATCSHIGQKTSLYLPTCLGESGSCSKMCSWQITSPVITQMMLKKWAARVLPPVGSAQTSSAPRISSASVYLVYYIFCFAVCVDEHFQQPTGQTGIKKHFTAFSEGWRPCETEKSSKKGKVCPCRLVAAIWLLSFLLGICRGESQERAAPGHESDTSQHHILLVDHKGEDRTEHLG